MKQQQSRHGVHWLLLVGILALAACDRQEPADEAATTGNAGIAVDSEAPADSALPAATEADIEKLAGVTETEGLTDAPAQPDDAALTQPAKTADADKGDWKYTEGADFRRMTTAQGTSSPPDKIEVAEVFWYGCGHCYNFDPMIAEWKTGKPDNVAFVRIPVIWNPTNQAHARLMYTAEALGVLDKLHGEIFKAIHESGKTLTSEADMIELFAKVNVDEAAFREAFNSFGVTSAVKRAENLTRRYGIKSVPVIIVNGKYATDAPNIKTFDDILAVTNELVAREDQELSAP
jgi:thiol:disulfide interchange protein DsbA